MRFLHTILLACCISALHAQTARINFRFPSDSSHISISLMSEKVGFRPSPSIGLTDSEVSYIAHYDIENQRAAMAEVEIKEPTLIRILISPKNQKAITWETRLHPRLMYVRPNDDITVTITNSKITSISGTSAPIQQFMHDNFRESFYDYLPALQYNPRSIDNSHILPKIDSLTRSRLANINALSTDQEFKTFAQAAIQTEDYLLRVVVNDKLARKGQGVKLTTDQRKELENYTLHNFKIAKDEALLSSAYRNELRNYIIILATQKYPIDTANQYPITANAIRYAYELSGDKLRNFPKQLEYLRTYWLDQAVTFQKNMTLAQNLLADFKQQYPSNKTLIDYFNNTIAAKNKMTTGATAPNFSLKDKEGADVSLTALKGKATCLIFCYNLKQHEVTLQPLEQQYGDKVNFVYINITPNTPFERWQQYAELRSNVIHLWASEEATEQLTKDYAPTMQYPFVLIDSQGKIVERWIMQGFPDNPELKKEIANFIKR